LPSSQIALKFFFSSIQATKLCPSFRLSVGVETEKRAKNIVLGVCAYTSLTIDIISHKKLGTSIQK